MLLPCSSKNTAKTLLPCTLTDHLSHNGIFQPSSANLRVGEEGPGEKILIDVR